MDTAVNMTDYANPTCCFEDTAPVSDYEIQMIVEDAIRNKKFQMYYQPIYSLSKKKFVSAEALIRLHTDKYGYIPPSVFIPIAERSGIIHAIGDFVTEEVFRFMASPEYKRLGLTYMEINLSTAQCMVSTLADRIIQLMKTYDISPNQVNFEITETAASFSQGVIEQNLQKLSKSGIGFSLDDYGTGYSNIERMVQYPLKIVKLDKLFADGLADHKIRIVLKNTVQMIKDIDMEIVVEGIETSDAFRLFKELGCEHIQGFYFCKPLPKDGFIKFIEGFNSL